MSADYQTILTHAMRNLAAFSLPGVGTFVRKLVPAKFDPSGKQLAPPSHTFEITAEQPAAVVNLVRFIEQRTELSSEQAQQVAQSMGNWVSEYLKTVGNMDVPGVGRIVKQPDGSYTFTSDKADPTEGHYGLPTIQAEKKEVAPPPTPPAAESPASKTLPKTSPPPTTQTPPSPKAEPKTEPKTQAIPENQPSPEAKPKAPAAQPQAKKPLPPEKPKKSGLSRAIRVFVLLAVVLVAALAGVYFFGEQLGIEMPFMPSSSTEASSPRAQSDGNEATDGSTQETIAAEDVRGVVYHVVVGQGLSQEEASSISAIWLDLGYEVQVLPMTEGEGFLLSLFEANNEKAATQKMEELRAALPSNASSDYASDFEVLKYRKPTI